MKLAELINALTKFNPAHPDCAGCHVWHDNVTDTFTAKKAFRADGVMDCILPTGERYLGCIAKAKLPGTSAYVEQWITERVGKGGKPDVVKAQPVKQAAPKKPEPRKAVKKGRK